jgi:glycosyltransferase involved in cell wall biosynthesis
MSKRGRATYRIAFVVGQTLGNAVYSNNLRQVVDDDGEIAASWYYVDYPRWAGVQTPGSPTAEREPLARDLAKVGGMAKSLVHRAIGGHRQYEVWAAWASMSAMRMLARDLASHRHDAILFHTGATALFSARLLRDRGVISLDGTPSTPEHAEAVVGKPYGGIAGAASHRLHSATYQAARALTPWSDWTKSSLALDYGVRPSRITVVPPGVDLAAWRPEPRRESAGPVKLLFVGRHIVQKGADVLLEAFTKHLKPGRYELDMVTKATLAPLPGLRVHHELPANGKVLRGLYAAADIFVFPTRWDAFGIAVIEAMASGLPVVASDLNAIPEIVGDGTSGLLVPPNDAAALATAIERLAGDPERRRQMGLEGRRIAEQRFDLVANANRVLDVLKQVAGKSRRPRSVTTVPVGTA